MKTVVKRTIIAGMVVLSTLSLSSQSKVKNSKNQGNRAANTTLTTVSQVPFWTENFGTANPKTGDFGIVASDYKGVNGDWTITRDSVGQKHNNWYISAMEGGIGVGNCSMGFDKDNNILNNTLHIGYDYKSVDKAKDQGAIYAKNESSQTDLRVESPFIDCSGKSNITVNFNYFTGGIAGNDFFALYYHDGTNWNLLTTFGPSPTNTICSDNDQALWRASDTYVLPSTADNNPEVRIGFRWKNESSIAGNTEAHSVAIDDITISDNTVSAPTPTNDPSAKAVNTTKTTVSTPVSSDKVYFNIYPNPNKGHFTVDFSGIENDHEVFITLANLENGKQVYSSSFFSKSIDMNKVDIYPDNIANGRYACTLTFEGIRKTVILVVQ